MTGESGFRPADLVVYSASNNRMIGFRELSAATFQEFWRGGCFGGFLCDRPDSQSVRVEKEDHNLNYYRCRSATTWATAGLDGNPARRHYGAAFLFRGRRCWIGSGLHPAMIRAYSRALALSVMPGKRLRSSMAADSSPPVS